MDRILAIILREESFSEINTVNEFHKEEATNSAVPEQASTFQYTMRRELSRNIADLRSLKDLVTLIINSKVLNIRDLSTMSTISS